MSVYPGDIVIADEEGIVVVPFSEKDRILKAAQARASKDSGTNISDWEKAHRSKIEEILVKKGFIG